MSVSNFKFMLWVLIENTTVIVGRDVLDAIFTSVGMAQGVHVATVHLEQSRVMEDSRKWRGSRNCFSCLVSY